MVRTVMTRFRLTLLPLLVAPLLSACENSTVRDTLGMTRSAPDEFRVVSRPPLSVPPEFSLRPPGTGESGAAAETPARMQAQEMILGTPGDTLRPGNAETAVMSVSSGELESTADANFLQRAGYTPNATATRQQLQQEELVKSEEEKSMLQKLREPSDKEPTVNPELEAERLRSNRDAGKPVTEGETPMHEPKDNGTLGRIFGY